jgi:hypothetical protein
MRNVHFAEYFPVDIHQDEQFMKQLSVYILISTFVCYLF